MAGRGPTPLDLDAPFLREEFFRGGPNGLDAHTVLRVVTADGDELFKFDAMMVTSISGVDTEKVSYFLKSNGGISLYSFGRAIQAFRVQCILIDGAVVSDLVDVLGSDAPDQAVELVGESSRRAYERFMALYEQELRISRAIRKRRLIELVMKGYKYTGYVVSEKSGFASNADWICVTNFEFVALRSELISVPESKLSRENEPFAVSLENTPDVEAARRNSGLL